MEKKIRNWFYYYKWYLVIGIAALCFLVPIVTLSGALPVLIGLLGAMGCTKVSVSPDLSVPFRVLCCLGITVLVWIAFIALLNVISLF